MARTTCLLCSAALEPSDSPGLQRHPEAVDCEVRFTDAWGVAVQPVIELQAVANLEPEGLDLKIYPFVDEVLAAIYEKAGVKRLGGVSSGRGWSSVSTFQRCPYAWNRRYRINKKPWFLAESPSLAIGSLIHTFLAHHYWPVDAIADLPPEVMRDLLRAHANPEFVDEAWRVFSAYRMFYSLEVLQPLAIEYDLKDPRTGESCRFDMIAYFPEANIFEREPGTYIMEHKSLSRFDDDNLEGWVNDGEVIGQVALWKRLGLDLRFGELKGVIMNLLGKHKEPRFHRTTISPASWQIAAHMEDLKRWEGLIQLACSTNSFPRARQGCLTRWGRCDHFDHCATGEDP